jgi:hypothetical protein
MNHWWRAYNEAVDDPKLILLSDKAHRAWFNLMCVASANSGILPDIKFIAVKLRTTPQQASSIIAELVQAELIDKRDDGHFEPHNWNGRQYKSDVSTERVKRFRKRERNVSSTVSETPPETDTETDVDDAVDASARAGASGKAAFDLAEQLLELAGHSRHAWPPGWCGAPIRVKTWLDQGWKPETIVAAVKAAAGRKHGSPANSVQFFENAIAEEHARQAAPLPQVEIREAQTVVVTNGKSQVRSGVVEAARRKAEYFEDQTRGRIESNTDALFGLPAR